MTKEQTLGYVVIAAKALKLNKAEINRLVSQVEVEMEFWTEEMAEQTFEEFKEV